jgi:hypothetical protein
MSNISPPPPVLSTGQALIPPTRGGKKHFLPLSPSLMGTKGEGGGLGGGELLCK